MRMREKQLIHNTHLIQLFMVKTNFKWVLAGAVALAALASCSKAANEKEVNPSFNSETNEVTTQFVLSVAPGTTPKTKLTDEVVQVNKPFRGMSAAHILTFELDNDNKKGSEFFIFKADDDKAVATRDYDLDNMATASDISEDNSARILELALPLQTNAMAVYALATKPAQGSMTNTVYRNTYGAIQTAGTGFNHDLTDIEFSLVNRLTDEAAFTRFGNLLARVLTSIVRTECKDGTSDRRYAYWWPQDADSRTWATREGDVQSGATLPVDDTDRLAHEAAGYTYVVGNASWMDMCDEYALNHDGDLSNNVIQSPLEEVLGEDLYQIVTIQADPLDPAKVELRAGSSASILKTMRDLNETLNRVINAIATSQKEQIAIEVAKEIRFIMSRYFATPDEWVSVNWKTIAQLVTAAQTYFPDYATAIAGSAFNADYLPSNTTLTGGFPLNLGLPMSSALLTVVDDPSTGIEFQYLDAVPAYGMGGASVPIVNYRFPPEILYWANSGIRVNDASKAKADYPNTVATWANPDEAKWAGWTNNGSVLSTTRSVAMMKQVNYGVALMQTNVSYSNLDGVVAYDNNSSIHEGEADNAITIDATSFKVTGVFIGGVTDRVGWDLTRINASDNKPDKIIYDRVSEGGFGIPLSGSASMYTTTWDNYIPQTDAMGNVIGLGRQEDQTDVYIALELVNNTGKDLWGELNLIRDGGTFYLVGKLDLAAAIAASSTTFPEEKFCHYPPYNPETGETIAVKRVFMQDYMTIANLKFTRNSLKHAYVTVPDLRSSQISLGLSVDLKWNEGLSFNVEL